MPNSHERQDLLMLRGRDSIYCAIPAADIRDRYQASVAQTAAIATALTGAAEPADTAGQLLGGEIQPGPRTINEAYV